MFPALYARWTTQYPPANLKEMFDLSQEYLERADAAGYDAGRMVGHRIQSVVLMFRGEVEQARFHASRSLQMYRAEDHGPLLARFGQDLKVQALIYVALSNALLGNIDEALEVGTESLDRARSLNHANTLAFSLWHIGLWLNSIIRDSEAVHRYGDEMLEVAHTHRLKFWIAFGQPLVAINVYGKSRAEALADAERAVGIWRHEFNARIMVPENLCRIADLYLDDGFAPVGKVPCRKQQPKWSYQG